MMKTLLLVIGLALLPCFSPAIVPEWPDNGGIECKVDRLNIMRTSYRSYEEAEREINKVIAARKDRNEWVIQRIQKWKNGRQFCVTITFVKV